MGPSLVGSTLLNKWRIYGSAGLGYAKQNDLLFNRGGFGIYLGTGFEYKLTKHFAIGVVMNDYITMFNIKNNNGHVSFDNLHVGLSLSYFF